ncbi:MAG: copper chaperone PCu(A)C [Alcanivoracaceae bacterium]|jgi:copper(I)-binding protein|nr:copper chaperone PCu(A)C [Alcanivoracaceae bacterium]
MMCAAFFKRALMGVALTVASGAYAELLIEDAWVRAVPANARTTAAYFTVRNTGEQSQTIVGVSASVAGAAEIHDWVETDGRKKMVRQHRLTVPAGEQVMLKSGGLHMMLFRLDPVPALGDSVQICIESAADEGRASKVCADAVVRHP